MTDDEIIVLATRPRPETIPSLLEQETLLTGAVMQLLREKRDLVRALQREGAIAHPYGAK